MIPRRGCETPLFHLKEEKRRRTVVVVTSSDKIVEFEKEITMTFPPLLLLSLCGGALDDLLKLRVIECI